MTTKQLELKPSAPDKELRATLYETGSLALRAIGPRGGWSHISLPASELAALAAFIAPEAPSGPLSSFDFELLADALDVLDPDGSEATARKQELEAWARQMAATGRGYLPEAVPGVTAPPIRVLVALDGGCLTHVGASVPGVQLVTLDYDTEGADEAELFDIPQDGGGTAEAFRSVGECDYDASDFWEGARDARPTAPVERLAMLRNDQEGKGAYFDVVRAEADALEAWLAEDGQEAVTA